MSKRKVFLHVGPARGAGDVIEPAILHHTRALAELGVRTPVQFPDEAFRAALDITWQHRTWGYRRREVEGAWAVLCRRLLKAKSKDTQVVSVPWMAGATADQIDLFLDQLPGTQRHVVLTPAGGSEAPDELVERWSKACGRPERVHILDGASAPEQLWRSFGRVVGFGTASLPVHHLLPVGPADLGEALDELERLRRRNESLRRTVEALQSRAPTRLRWRRAA